MYEDKSVILQTKNILEKRRVEFYLAEAMKIRRMNLWQQ